MTIDTTALDAWWTEKLSEVDPILSAAGVVAAWWSFDLDSDGIRINSADLEQCLTIITTTARGSDPHRPTFASNIFDYIDRPVSEAALFVVPAVTDAIELWEPRLQVDAVRVAQFSPVLHGLSVSVEWSIPESNASGLLDIAVQR